MDYRKLMSETIEPYVQKYEKTGYFNSGKAKIFYRTYIIDKNADSIVISHGFTENSEKYKEVVYRFLNEGFNVFIMDHRGHGRSSREVSDPGMVYVEKFDDYVTDFLEFEEKVVKTSEIGKKRFLYAHSMGSLVALGALEKNQEFFSKAVFSTPMFLPITVVPKNVMYRYASRRCNKGRDKEYVPFVHKGWPDKMRFDLVSAGSKEKYAYYYEKCVKNPEYQTFSASNGWMKAVLEGVKDITRTEELEKITVPVLVYEVKGDSRVRISAIRRFVRLVKTSRLEVVHGGTRHELHTTKEEIFNPYMDTICEFYENTP